MSSYECLLHSNRDEDFECYNGGIEVFPETGNWVTDSDPSLFGKAIGIVGVSWFITFLYRVHTISSIPIVGTGV